MLVHFLFAQGVLAEDINRHQVDFSGSWELDYQLSDHSNEKIRWMYVQAKSEAERQMERAGNGRNFRVDPRIMNFQSIIGLGRLTEKIAQATVLTISQEGDHIVVKRNDDFSLVCNFTDMQVRQSIFGAEGCEWQEDQLTFQIALPDGLRVFHRLSIAPDGTRLNVATTVAVSGSRYPFTLNRVYMPFEAGAGQYNCQYTIASQTTCTLNGSGGGVVE